MSPDVDLSVLASLTEGFCGADLQALVYNAHLEVVHTIVPPQLKQGSVLPEELDYVSSNKQQVTVLSKADMDAMQHRVSLGVFPTLVLLTVW